MLKAYLRMKVPNFWMRGVLGLARFRPTGNDMTFYPSKGLFSEIF